MIQTLLLLVVSYLLFLVRAPVSVLDHNSEEHTLTEKLVSVCAASSIKMD